MMRSVTLKDWVWGMGVACVGLVAHWAVADAPPDMITDLRSEGSTLSPGLPSIFIVGDSTAARGKGKEQQGWAEPFKAFFDPQCVNVLNRARGGRSSRTFVTEGLWQELMREVQAGDVVLLQFGHNDGGAINEEPPGSTRPARARGTLPGLGLESVQIDNVVTGKAETVYTFGHYLRRMITEVREKQAQPVLLNLTLRNLRDDRGRLERGSGSYGGWIYQLAREHDVPFIDLTHRLADQFDAMPVSEVDALFEQDYVHFNQRGAELHAAEVLSGLKGLRSVTMEGWLSEKGRSIAKDDTAWLKLPVPLDRSLPTIYLIGDSTVRNGRGDGSNGEWGWGDFLNAWMDPARVHVVNRAVGGLSSRTFLSYGHWGRVQRMLQPGDAVVIQFGHNDAAPINDQHRARGTLEGVGPASESIVNVLTGCSEVVHSYGWYLRHYIGEIRAAGAVPILCSPVPRKRWQNREIVRDHNQYALWARQVAEQEGVAFVDLHARVAAHYDALGPQAVELLFADAHTHTSAAGALLNASVFVEGIGALSTPLNAWRLKPEGRPHSDE